MSTIKSCDACTVAICLLALNMGLSMLLTFLTAGHSPVTSLDQPGSSSLTLKSGSTYVLSASTRALPVRQAEGADALMTPRGLRLTPDGDVPFDSATESAVLSLKKEIAEPCNSSSSLNVPADVANEPRLSLALRTTKSELHVAKARAESACKLRKCKVYYVHIHKSGGAS